LPALSALKRLPQPLHRKLDIRRLQMAPAFDFRLIAILRVALEIALCVRQSILDQGENGLIAGAICAAWKRHFEALSDQNNRGDMPILRVVIQKLQCDGNRLT